MRASWRMGIVWSAILAAMPGCSLAPKSFKGIANPAPLVRARAIPLGRNLSDNAVVPSLLSSLDDKDQVVRLSAHEELKKRSGQDFGYVPYADPAERAPAISKWREWWGSRLVMQEPRKRRSRRDRQVIR